ncbi:CLUMA_CG018410, isoform A [Clunio marinus]|uniref:CLUMA_CG018410, isoform A n=1 Tax=Clunio marinus TaxID=568069 RepID=A0A1J1IYE7_9DIPT|nr:CLUMA_CG018410, isoform A [Clunio marinus]
MINRLLKRGDKSAQPAQSVPHDMKDKRRTRAKKCCTTLLISNGVLCTSRLLLVTLVLCKIGNFIKCIVKIEGKY